MVNFIFLFFYSYYHMKKNTIKAFTLVEMLIVIVIIGILIASLMPRMQSAQGRARDVSRKNDLNQISTSLIAYFWDTNQMPGCADGEANHTDSVECKLAVDEASPLPVDKAIVAGALDKVPTDPLWDENYGYIRTARKSHDGKWFVLFAKVEVPWSANYVAEDATAKEPKKEEFTDTADIVLCSSVMEGDANKTAEEGDTECTYDPDDANDVLYYVISY